ncbi:hypothetical protein C9374_007056 [Naegleria lovaniensis]|uniref:Uncharacterized protein n=1 Tax=Naegleria lovaniensis TaxID=51637 RepID=A0AA88H2J9_NAELO|nr:uncharacterized protein C9374_007056 [Naegleria lovaniensis]KAG2393525.1 hypothetical protein C9374_007056 [Naegleria lovaniensis]
MSQQRCAKLACIVFLLLVIAQVSYAELFDTLTDLSPKPPTTLTIQPESNGWWIQLKVTPPRVTKRIRVTFSSGGQTETVFATSPSWDSTQSYFTAKTTKEIPTNSQVKFTVIKQNGKAVRVSMQWRKGNRASLRSSSSNSNNDKGGSKGSSDASGRKIAYATWYDEKAAGTPVCGFKTNYCGAPSDAFKGLGERVGPCWGASASKTCQNCAKGYCYGPSCQAPQCKKGGCGIKIKLWCADTAPGACKTSEPIIMTVNNVCPKSHPCNTCKGKHNPCARSNHLDLCQNTFFALANHQPRRKGLRIAYQVLGK